MPPLKTRLFVSALTMTSHKKMARQSIDGFTSHAIQSYRKLEDIIVVFSPRIDLADTVNQFAQRNPPAKIAHGNLLSLFTELNLHLIAMLHDKFVDAVVDHLFQHYIDAIIGI